MQAVREKEWGQQAMLQREKIELEEKLGEIQRCTHSHTDTQLTKWECTDYVTPLLHQTSYRELEHPNPKLSRSCHHTCR